MKPLLLMVVAILCSASSIGQTVYDIEAVRPFQGEPPLQDSERIRVTDKDVVGSTISGNSSSAGNNAGNNVQMQAQPVSTVPPAASETSDKDEANKAMQKLVQESSIEFDQPEHDFIGEPTVVTSENAESSPKTTTVVTARRIYQCRDGRGNIFVDEENKANYSDCSMVRDQEVMTVVTQAPNVSKHIDYCTGMVQFRGNTYVFDGKTPCPIPAEVFQLLTPLEAQPAYYLDPPPLS